MKSDSIENKKYQIEYASGRPQMYDEKSRVQKAKRIVKALELYFGKQKLKQVKVLDLGASSGIIDNEIAKHVGSLTGIDIDKGAIKHAKNIYKAKNLSFKIDDALGLKTKDLSFDVVICTHVYEHVTNPKKLFSEIYRVLKPGGICYLAAVNKFWIIEPHYNLPFLSMIPKNIANHYVKLFGKADQYYEELFSYWQLKNITKKFRVVEINNDIYRYPKKYGYDDVIKPGGLINSILKLSIPFSKITSPTFFWILIK